MAKQQQPAPKLYVEVSQFETRSTCCFSFRIRDENAAEGDDVVFDRWLPPAAAIEDDDVEAIEFDPQRHHRTTYPSRHAADRAGRRFIRRYERAGNFTTPIGVTAGGK